MQTSFISAPIARPSVFAIHRYQLGGDQSPLNDSDADEDRDPESYLDLEILGLDDFVDADKIDPTITGDIGSASLG
ncbi:hypothetical protein J3P77_13565 [Pseudomonas sp. R1-18]|uniref:hypothetical protein n=1 Tax=Pseudomonas sp. R1-18 TaxID=1632772 RepID=UPI003DA8EE5F